MEGNPPPYVEWIKQDCWNTLYMYYMCLKKKIFFLLHVSYLVTGNISYPHLWHQLWQYWAVNRVSLPAKLKVLVFQQGQIIDYSWTKYKTHKKHLKIKGVSKADAGILHCKGTWIFAGVKTKAQLRGRGRGEDQSTKMRTLGGDYYSYYIPIV